MTPITREQRIDGRHYWFQRPEMPWVTCQKCGMVKRPDGGNSRCRGVVKVGLRLDPTPKQEG